MAELPLCHHVQELAMNGGDRVPERFFHQNGDYGAAYPVIEIPVIDFSLLKSSGAPEGTGVERRELERLRLALETCGCFQAINHGIEFSLLEKLRRMSEQFFSLPMEEKKKYSRADNGFQGYGNDMVLSDHQTLDWNDRLYLTVHPQDQQNLRYWPEKPPHFRETLLQYTMSTRMITENLLKAMARSINLEENSFLKQYDERPMMEARFNYYPPCPRPDKVLGIKPHADGSAITILLQDKEVEGLQILKDDQWFRVPIVPHALLINVGDQIEIMSNGLFKSPVHRVVTNSEKERMTLAMFFIPDPGKGVEPVEGFISDERPRRYKKVSYSLDFYFRYYQQGKRPIDAAKI